MRTPANSTAGTGRKRPEAITEVGQLVGVEAICRLHYPEKGRWITAMPVCALTPDGPAEVAEGTLPDNGTILVSLSSKAKRAALKREIGSIGVMTLKEMPETHERHTGEPDGFGIKHVATLGPDKRGKKAMSLHKPSGNAGCRGMLQVISLQEGAPAGPGEYTLDPEYAPPLLRRACAIAEGPGGPVLVGPLRVRPSGTGDKEAVEVDGVADDGWIVREVPLAECGGVFEMPCGEDEPRAAFLSAADFAEAADRAGTAERDWIPDTALSSAASSAARAGGATKAEAARLREILAAAAAAAPAGMSPERWRRAAEMLELGLELADEAARAGRENARTRLLELEAEQDGPGSDAATSLELLRELEAGR